ncbi:hypothetical protein ASPWEDRAFT_41068 [Aspergillus wentii DTO 134E9]|uniref:NAD-dependent epimerase/dehydratase domain-containing protein n=1 Tax=Aspergillus wentii DTO 134E9 TaxID=1073089 RepID=A0A1L9RLW6_ASPWE|nr:uncharacterized protein ASPWEDRAFT_41068 [Aspergillus wentii DTO 134E9]OJJ35827.1 hypothetical protein ASPWEDRAFT_41068 [Aspergillus wentii DTO 134E9]
MPQFTTALPSGSTILVTGVNGFVASHVADQLLHHGYRIRGSVRDMQKSSWLQNTFEKKYGNDRFELVQVEDMTVDGAWDKAIQDATGIIHVATIFGRSDLVTAIMQANEKLLTAAKKSNVKRFIYTSSSEAAIYTSADKRGQLKVDPQSWNEQAVKDAETPGEDLAKGFQVYCASKTRGEQAIWKWVDENQPQFVLNTVLPSLCFGRSVDPKNQGHASSSAWPSAIFRNELETIKPIIGSIIPTGAYCVDVQDVARLHVAGLLHSDVENERLFAFGSQFVWNDITTLYQKAYPDREFAKELPSMTSARPLEIERAGRAEWLLKEMGTSGWTALEDTLKANIEDLV